MTYNSVTILGGGAWGTALAITALRAGRGVTCWAREPDVAEALAAGQGNPMYLPGLDLPAMPATTDLRKAVSGADAILAVVPAQFTRAVFDELAPVIPNGMPVALCAKGIEQGSLKLMTEVLAETLPQAQAAVLSGPSFAGEVARGLPTAVTLASADEALARRWIETLGQPTFRPYWTDDLVGAEIGGAVKNVLAIACGIVEGLGLGRSAHAALISRGFAEMTRLAVALGARAETLAGLCGLGDLVLTCSSSQSRNMSFGKALGEGRAVDRILAERSAVTEGVATAPGIVALAERQGVDMPICEGVAKILAGEFTVETAITRLLERPFRMERLSR